MDEASFKKNTRIHLSHRTQVPRLCMCMYHYFLRVLQHFKHIQSINLFDDDKNYYYYYHNESSREDEAEKKIT